MYVRVLGTELLWPLFSKRKWVSLGIVLFVNTQKSHSYMLCVLWQVLIFAEKKADVDAIHEYLLLKGVEAVAIHGGKDQEERTKAIEAFRDGKKDVLVATDVASKGLDFPAIQHVINYDMPEEIENYGGEWAQQGH